MKLGLFCSTVMLLKLVHTRCLRAAKFVIFSARRVNPLRKLCSRGLSASGTSALSHQDAVIWGCECAACTEEPVRMVLSTIHKEEGRVQGLFHYKVTSEDLLIVYLEGFFCN